MSYEVELRRQYYRMVAEGLARVIAAAEAAQWYYEI